MSYQLDVYVFNEDEQVFHTRSPGGFTSVTMPDDEIIGNVLDTIAFLDARRLETTGQGFPEWDMFWISIDDRIVEYRKP